MVQIISEDSGQISSLLGLIKEAATTLEAGYAKGPGGVPCLDDTAPHPLDRNISTPEMREATQVLEGACAQLCAVLARPNHTVLNNFFLTALQPSCLRIALEFNIPDILQHKPSGMHVAEISKICGVDASKLARILRLLTAKHCFREGKYLSPKPITTPSSNPLYSLGLHMSVLAPSRSTALTGASIYPQDGGHDAGGDETRRDARGRGVGAFSHSYARCVQQVHFAAPRNVRFFLARTMHTQTPAMHEHGERFGVAMIGWGTAVEAEAVVSAYHWHTLPPGATVCDLGGGVGALSMQLARAHPTLHIALQDLPERMVQAAQTVWPAACPEALAEGRVNFRAIDFFKEVPLAGCDVYYLKNILHAFQEAQCITILKGVRQAMKRGSRVLIHEYILQMAAAAASSSYSAQNKQLARAPAPLLSNYGAGRIRQYYLDVSLMVLINSKERTLEEYVALGEAAGLRFVRVWAFGDMSGVELCASEEGED